MIINDKDAVRVQLGFKKMNTDSPMKKSALRKSMIDSQHQLRESNLTSFKNIIIDDFTDYDQSEHLANQAITHTNNKIDSAQKPKYKMPTLFEKNPFN